MTLMDCCQVPVVTVPPDTPVYDVARIMAEQNVGSVVIVEEKRPVGILTDRDITVRVTAEGLDPTQVPVRTVMTGDITVLPAASGLYEALGKARERNVRRVPVVDDQGALVGILTVDDIIALLAEEMGRIAEVIRAGRPKI